MSSTGVAARRRAVAVVPGMIGAALLARPQQVMSAVCGTGVHPADWIVRVLGARMVGQAVVTGARPTVTVELAGIAADLSHAASMVWLTRREPRYRRPAVTSATVATLSAVASVATLRAARARA